MSGKREYVKYSLEKSIEVYLDAELLAENKRWKQETDYVAFLDFDQETVIPLLNQVKNFNLEIERLINLSLE